MKASTLGRQATLLAENHGDMQVALRLPNGELREVRGMEVGADSRGGRWMIVAPVGDAQPNPGRQQVREPDDSPAGAANGVSPLREVLEGCDTPERVHQAVRHEGRRRAIAAQQAEFERLSKAAQSNPVVHAVISQGGSAVDCVEALAKQVEDSHIEINRLLTDRHPVYVLDANTLDPEVLRSLRLPGKIEALPSRNPQGHRGDFETIKPPPEISFWKRLFKRGLQ